MNTKTILPTGRTLQPSRSGLCHHEQLADAFLHTASVFGFEDDENLIPRVATLAFCNGVHLVNDSPLKAAEAIERISQSLEMGQSRRRELCGGAEAQAPETDSFSTLRVFFRERCGAGTLRTGNPEDVLAIRQLIAEAAVAGLYCRAAAPRLYGWVKEDIVGCQGEQYFLSSRLLFWSGRDGLPNSHPLLELSDGYYRKSPREKELVRDILAELLLRQVDEEDPWQLDNWLATAWKNGVWIARLAPDQVEELARDVGPRSWALNLEIFDHCVAPQADPGTAASLLASLEAYLAKWHHEGLAQEDCRKANPRMLLQRAVDYALWMGLIAETPLAAGGRRAAE